jgi:excisionase family DNA binding protein
MTKLHKLNVKEAAKHMGVSNSTLYRLVELGQAPAHYKISNRLFFDKVDLDTFLAANKTPCSRTGTADDENPYNEPCANTVEMEFDNAKAAEEAAMKRLRDAANEIIREGRQALVKTADTLGGILDATQVTCRKDGVINIRYGSEKTEFHELLKDKFEDLCVRGVRTEECL